MLLYKMFYANCLVNMHKSLMNFKVTLLLLTISEEERR